eukprot:15431687-Alexandrium_andersonii.AAC.1
MGVFAPLWPSARGELQRVVGRIASQAAIGGFLGTLTSWLRALRRRATGRQRRIRGASCAYLGRAHQGEEALSGPVGSRSLPLIAFSSWLCMERRGGQ